jgi:hypothetical protein
MHSHASLAKKPPQGGLPFHAVTDMPRSFESRGSGSDVVGSLDTGHTTRFCIRPARKASTLAAQSSSPFIKASGVVPAV